MERLPVHARDNGSEHGSQASTEPLGSTSLQLWVSTFDPEGDYERVRTYADQQACDRQRTLSWVYCPIIRAIAGCTVPEDRALLDMLSQPADDTEAAGCFGHFLGEAIRQYQQLFRQGHETRWIVQPDGLRLRHQADVGNLCSFPYIPAAATLYGHAMETGRDPTPFAEPADILSAWPISCSQEGILGQSPTLFNRLKACIEEFRAASIARYPPEPTQPPAVVQVEPVATQASRPLAPQSLHGHHNGTTSGKTE